MLYRLIRIPKNKVQNLVIHTKSSIGGNAMRNTAKNATIALSLAALFAGASLMPMTASADAAKGKDISWDRKKGNCLACHMMPGGVSPGDIGPPLVAMKARFPDRKKLFNQIYDAASVNASTRMPPFGKHKALSNADIDHIVDYLYTL
jgi:sulfur-oxidizing protein SoxX